METFLFGEKIIQKSRGIHALMNGKKSLFKLDWLSGFIKFTKWVYNVFPSPRLTGLKGLRKILAQIRAIQEEISQIAK